MTETVPAYFDPETVALLRGALDDAWDRIAPSVQARTTRSLLAERILKTAATGERNRERLVAAALRLKPAA